MTPETPIPAQPRNNAISIALIAGLIAFLVGLAVMAAVFQFGGWWMASTSPAAQQPVPAAAPLAAGIDIATLNAREQTLAARLDAIDARMRSTDADARTAASYAGRAEAMMVVLSARRALERGQPLGYIDSELRRRFGTIEPQAVTNVVRAAGEPVTLEDLRLAFDQIAPRLSTGEASEGWWDALRRELSTLVIIRHDNAPSPHPRERLARARQFLAQSHVEAALAEVARLPGAQGAESWMAAAGRYVETRRALDALEAAAVKGQVEPAAGATQPLVSTPPVPAPIS